MSLHENTSLYESTLFGSVDIVADAIALLKQYEPPEGYYLAFSGGKDSIVMKDLCIKSGVKFDAHYNFTSVDPPELVKYIRKHHPDVIIERPPRTMFQLIVQKGIPPTRIIRYCCEQLKERGGKKRWKLLGIRAEESIRRADRLQIQLYDTTIHPILYWKEYHIWDYIDAYHLPYCSLYDEGNKRLGCVLCPMQSRQARLRDIENYPNFHKAYLSAFRKMIETRKQKGLPVDFTSAEQVMEWWLER